MRIDSSFALWILGGVGIWIFSVVAAAFSRVLADECKDWMPTFTKWIIRRSIARLPEDHRERFQEEWQSHINEIPGQIGKVVTAVGFVLAAKRMSSETANKRPRIVNAECHIVARVELRGAAIVRANSRGVLTVGGVLTTPAASAAEDRIVMETHEKQADPQKPEWLSYEEVASYLLNRFAHIFRLEFVEGKQNIQGQRSGTTWTIDAKGIAEGNEGFFIVECRRYTTSKQNQEKVGALAYRISDTGAAGGILVSPLGVQEGAAKIAAAENIISVELGANSTPNEFSLRFLNNIFIGMNIRIGTRMRASATVLRECAKCGKRFHVLNNAILCNDCDK
jgi:hypothetical protein